MITAFRRTHRMGIAGCLLGVVSVINVAASCHPLSSLFEPATAALQSAVPVVWRDDAITLEGEITGLLDVDTFDLGPLAVGTRLTVDVEGSDGLDPVAAVFDDAENRVAFADDVDFPAGLLSARIDEVTRRPSERFVLAVAGFGISPKPATAGRYVARVSRSPDAVPPLQSQTIVIRYQGGEGVFVDDEILGRLGPWTIPAFDADAIIPRFADRVDDIKRDLIEFIAGVYSEFDVRIVDDDSPLPEAPFSSVYFVHGIAEVDAAVPIGIAGIARADFYNRQQNEAIFVFVERLAALSPGAEVFTHLVANLTAHEIGHALGLLHVRGAGALMAPSLPIDACCALQEFGRGPMVEFPVGFEDPVFLLQETVREKNSE